MRSQTPETSMPGSPHVGTNERLRAWLLAGALTLIAFGIAYVVFVLIAARMPTDLQVHAHNAQKSLATFRWPPHFLYFAFVGVGSLVTSGSEAAFVRVSLFVVAGAFALKYLVSTTIAFRELQPAPGGGVHAAPRLVFWGVLLGMFVLLFAHSLPRTPFYYSAAGQPWPSAFKAYCFYAGRATSTIWHNSTIVFSMPFVLLLFHETFLLLLPVPTVRPLRLLFLVGLVIAAKPSFLLAMGPVLPVLVFWQHRFGRPFWAATGAVAFAGLLLVAQSRWLAAHSPTGYGVGFGFMRVWGPLAPVLPLDLLASFGYPVLFALLFPRAAADRLYVYAAALAAAAVAIGMTLCETPPFTDAGNFMWQIHICCSLWFFATLIAHLRELSASGRRPGWRDVLVFGCLGLHVLNGVAYLIRSLVLRSLM